MAVMLKRINVVRAQLVRKAQAIGKSRAGNVTKIHRVIDSYGLSAEFEITGGEVSDCFAVPELIIRLLLVRKGLRRIRAMTVSVYGGEIVKDRVVILRKRNLVKGNADMGWVLYRYRHLVKNTFTWLQQYRVVTT